MASQGEGVQDELVQEQNEVFDVSVQAFAQLTPLNDQWLHVKSISAFIKSTTDAQGWYNGIEVIENLGWLSRELIQLRNQVHGFSSLSPDSNRHPTTNSPVDRALRDTSGVGSVLFENLSLLSRLAKAVAQELWAAADGDTNDLVRKVQDADDAFKQLDVVPDNAMNEIDLLNRDECQWYLYHLRQQLDTIDSGTWGIMSVFRPLGQVHR